MPATPVMDGSLMGQPYLACTNAERFLVKSWTYSASPQKALPLISANTQALAFQLFPIFLSKLRYSSASAQNLPPSWVKGNAPKAYPPLSVLPL
jgi:hypothetical protein